MHRPKRWTVAAPNPAADDLAARLKASPVLCQILLNRGMSDPAECTAFLRPSLKQLCDPAGIPNLPAAAERIARAIADKQKIVIYGDYDVDGITATAILWHAITLLGGQVDYYIPHRVEEGYGLNAEALTQICDQGAGLIITVDCGITAIEPARIAADRGIDLIITDHHEWHAAPASENTADNAPRRPLLPACHTLVHPRLPSDQPAYANPHLCGAGVAFKLAWGIGQAVNGAARVSEEFRAFLLEATALAALGTIADVVPLTGENRTIAHFGLSALKQSRLTGIAALIESAALTGQKLDSYHVGFLLAPRLNACGRMGHAALAVEMLTKAGSARAREIAAYLEKQNRERQGIERKILDEALDQIARLKFDADNCSAIVLGSTDWHPGVIGIVASRIVDRFNRPTIMVALTDDRGQGSGRSIAGFHLAKALEACAPFLEAYGGHEMAAGLKLQASRFEDFRSAFAAHAASVLAPDQLIPELRLECDAELSQITAALAVDLQRLAPFGQGNRKPLLRCGDLRVAAPPRRVGKTGEHLQLQVRQGNAIMRCIAFNQGALLDRLEVGRAINLAVEPALNEFNGYTNVELAIKDLQFA